jgi:hypothetical protein
MTIIVRAGKTSSGRDVMEELLVSPEADAWRLLRSPGLVLGTTVDEARDVRVLRRGGNVAVQLFFMSDGADVVKAALAAFADIEARLDGESNRQVVFTIPFAVGFEAIEKRLAIVMRSCPGADWMYGNVYDENRQPLSWWSKPNS